MQRSLLYAPASEGRPGLLPSQAPHARPRFASGERGNRVCACARRERPALHARARTHVAASLRAPAEGLIMQRTAFPRRLRLDGAEAPFSVFPAAPAQSPAYLSQAGTHARRAPGPAPGGPVRERARACAGRRRGGAGTRSDRWRGGRRLSAAAVAQIRAAAAGRDER